jgi:hypothetical protein
LRLSSLAISALFLTPALVVAQTPSIKPRPVAEPIGHPTSSASELPITRVALYKNGVGFFEHAGRVIGDQAVTIDFTSAQLNDVLQSLTAIDLNGGRISGAGYNSTTPLDEQLKTLALGLNSSPSDIDFYQAIRGARVLLSQPGATSFTGRLLSIDLRTTSSPDHRFVTVVSDAGQARTVELTPAVSVTLLDTALHTDITRYLELIASNRSQGLRHLTLFDHGPDGPARNASRDLRVSYISEVPVWKSTYRILFTDSKLTASPTATVQGWSVVDNTTGGDWTNVHLDLIAGAPQSFIQPLSIPYYARRPEIGLPSEVQLAPQTHDSGELAGSGGATVRGIVTDQSGAIIPRANVTVTNLSTGQQISGQSSADGRFAIPVGQPGQYKLSINSPGFQNLTMNGVSVGTSPTGILNAQLNVGSTSQTVEVTANQASVETSSASIAGLPLISSKQLNSRADRYVDGFTGGRLPAPPPPPPVADYAEAAQASVLPQTANTSFDDFFQYSINDPITIRKNESALVPILQAKLPVERVTLWSAAQPVALRALWITNSSTLTLDRGSFSIVENGSFGGEGLLDPIHPGEKRLLSYAADQAVHVANGSGAQQHRLRSIVIAKGVLTEHYRDVVERDYTIRNAAPDSRVVIVEHRRLSDHQLSPTTHIGVPGRPDELVKPDETTPTSYRFRVEVPPGATVHLYVAESHAYPRTMAINSINDQQVRVLVLEMGSDTAIAKQLQPVLDAQREVADLDAKSTALGERLDGLDKEEERQRANIVTLKDADKLAQKRFVDELGHIEDQILDLQKQQQTLDTQLEAARADLANKVQAVQFNQTLEP